MRRVVPPPEPDVFDSSVRQPGNAWLSRNLDHNGHLPQGGRPPGRWNVVKQHLAFGFGNLCGYSAMYEPVGTIDHYLSCDNYPGLAYEWSNYRYSSGWINSSKGVHDDAILDPFEVSDDWFELLLPSLQLVATSAVPPQECARVEFTLNTLHLGHDERVLRQRQQWYQMYRDGKLSLEGLGDVAPLIADAVNKEQKRKSP